MDFRKLIFVVGCNAAGKSTFIRSRLNDLASFEVIMTDVYKSRTKEVFRTTVSSGKNIIVETVFNDSSFIDLVDIAKAQGYHTSLLVLFLDSLKKSVERVAFRGEQESGIVISGSNIKLNFEESFKNVANYYFYFDVCEFIHTGFNGVNEPIMSFELDRLKRYRSNELSYPQRFAAYSYRRHRLDNSAYDVISKNLDFEG